MLDSEAPDMMPWRMYAAENLEESTLERVAASERSAWVHVVRALEGSAVGAGGLTMSVRRSLIDGEDSRRAEARAWPTKPAPPVMRIVDEDMFAVLLLWWMDVGSGRGRLD